MRYQLLQGCSFILAQLYDILFHGVLLDSFFLTPQGYPFSLLSSILLGQTTRYQPWLWQDAGRPPHNMLYVDGQSGVANPLVNLQVDSYTLDRGADLAPTMFLV